jgi:hypothetical protein
VERYSSSRVLRAIRQGNSWPVVAETAAGPFVVKLRGAAHGTAALVAEIIVAEIAEAIGLQVPARALIAFDATLISDDRRDELADLLAASHGVNLGFQFLSQARDVRPEDLARIDADTATRIVWLDWLVMNPDRTAVNPNLLWSDDGVWLIDHGSSLGFHFNWPRVTEQSPERPFLMASHLLLARASGLARFHDEMAASLSRDTLRTAVRAVPDDFLVTMERAHRSLLTLPARREAYVAFLWKRLHRARPATRVAS